LLRKGIFSITLTKACCVFHHRIIKKRLNEVIRRSTSLSAHERQPQKQRGSKTRGRWGLLAVHDERTTGEANRIPPGSRATKAPAFPVATWSQSAISHPAASSLFHLASLVKARPQDFRAALAGKHIAMFFNPHCGLDSRLKPVFGGSVSFVDQRHGT
jgi:hypothetical protein